MRLSPFKTNNASCIATLPTALIGLRSCAETVGYRALRSLRTDCRTVNAKLPQQGTFDAGLLRHFGDSASRIASISNSTSTASKAGTTTHRDRSAMVSMVMRHA